MLNAFVTHQKYILIFCGLVCIMLAFFIMVMNFKSVKRKKALIKITLGVGVLVFADAAGYFFDGSSTIFGYWGNRFSIFLVFIFVLANTCFLVEYTTFIFMETGKFETLPKRLRMGFMLPIIGMILVVISQFTGMYYYFDDSNKYQRGPLFIVSALIPIITVVVLLSFACQNGKLIDKWLFGSLVFFALSPIVSASLQLSSSGINYIDFISWIAVIVLFWIALMGQNNELADAAYTDVVTGLPNADGYILKTNKIISHGDIMKYTGYYLDIARMGYYNNKYGKRLGDEIILLYAKALKQATEKDEIIGRLGGNYFVALIKRENSQKFLELLGDTPLEIVFDGKKETIHLSAVAGCYEIDKKNIVAPQILTNTSAALSYAKNVARKPYVFLDSALEAEFERIRVIEADARAGLKNNEFEVFYQPKVDVNGNVLCGAEALVRWRKNGTIVPPMSFIPILERNTGICDLDFYVLNRVCKDIKEWIEKGYEPMTVSVNFSRKNLGTPILAEAISKVVEKYDIPKNLIQIEVTETLDEFPLDYLIGVVEAIGRYGMTVAIDDFGTGSSSINLLKLVKFDVLKIDKAFIDYKNDKEKQLLSDIIQMANNIDIDVIAEGVEEREQVETLLEMGCHMIQGYVFDKPLSKEDFEKRLVGKSYK